MPEARKRILVVDDEEDVCESMSVFLRRNGYGVSVALTGQEGLAKAKKEKPNLIILDLVLPDVEGSDVASELLQYPPTRDIPIIFLTSIVTKSEQDVSGEMVGNRCIVAKPCKTDEILMLVKERLGSAL